MNYLAIAVMVLAAFACQSPQPPAPDYSQCELDVVEDFSGNGVIDLPDVVECIRRLNPCAGAETGEEFLACSEQYGG